MCLVFSLSLRLRCRFSEGGNGKWSSRKGVLIPHSQLSSIKQTEEAHEGHLRHFTYHSPRLHWPSGTTNERPPNTCRNPIGRDELVGIQTLQARNFSLLSVLFLLLLSLFLCFFSSKISSFSRISLEFLPPKIPKSDLSMHVLAFACNFGA